jgi:hypothetical protein
VTAGTPNDLPAELDLTIHCKVAFEITVIPPQNAEHSSYILFGRIDTGMLSNMRTSPPSAP